MVDRVPLYLDTGSPNELAEMDSGAGDRFPAALLPSTAVTTSGAQTLADKTFTAPTIGSFVNAQHSHETAAQGGKMGPTALTPAPERVVAASWDDGTPVANATGRQLLAAASLTGGKLTATGDTLRVLATGRLSTGAAPTFTFELDFGATNVFVTGAATPVGALTDRAWSIEFLVRRQAIGTVRVALVHAEVAGELLAASPGRTETVLAADLATTQDVELHVNIASAADASDEWVVETLTLAVLGAP